MGLGNIQERSSDVKQMTQSSKHLDAYQELVHTHPVVQFPFCQTKTLLYKKDVFSRGSMLYIDSSFIPTKYYLPISFKTCFYINQVTQQEL